MFWGHKASLWVSFWLKGPLNSGHIREKTKNIIPFVRISCIPDATSSASCQCCTQTLIQNMQHYLILEAGIQNEEPQLHFIVFYATYGLKGCAQAWVSTLAFLPRESCCSLRSLPLEKTLLLQPQDCEFEALSCQRLDGWVVICLRSQCQRFLHHPSDSTFFRTIPCCVSNPYPVDWTDVAVIVNVVSWM